MTVGATRLMRTQRAVALSAAITAACSPSIEDTGNEARGHLSPIDLRIESVSTRPYLVTGGDVLLRVTSGRDFETSDIEIHVDGRDVTDAFRPAEPGGPLIGLVEGLVVGDHEIEARTADGGASQTLQVTNYPITGPIISGPHQSPYVCQTEDFRTAIGEPLGPALDDDCSVETRVDYVYLSAMDNRFKPYVSVAAAPMRADVAQTTTLDGQTVPFIVRVQTGTVNRAIYQSAILHDPTDPEPDPWTRSAGWNGKLVYTHGGGCRSGWFRQGSGTGLVLNAGLLGMGYAVTSSSLNVFGQNCNDLLASETHIMVKERFVESYGQPIYAIATGGSGGSYQSHQTADNYPGVFDGIIVSSSFPDVTSATIFTLADARLLHHYFTEVAPDLFTEEEQRMVSGFGSWGSIPNLSRGAARMDPTHSPDAAPEAQGAEVALPELEAMRYSESNPQGIRATVYDHTVNAYGVDENSGFAARPLDNRGVQYGFEYLNLGEISPAQFIALNRDIGGFDADLNHIPERHRADPTAARRALDTGRILNGGAGLASTPVIDYRSYTDHREGGDIHMIIHQYSTRSRIASSTGRADHHVMSVGGEYGFSDDRPDLGVLFRNMDEWLMNLVTGDASGPRSERVAETRPADLVDHCWDVRGPERATIREPLDFNGYGPCMEIYPAYHTPRHVADAPLSNDIVSCVLTPIDVTQYDVSFTDEEWAELEAVFPDGVCDWSEGDAHSEGYQGTWLSFGPSPVNRAR